MIHLEHYTAKISDLSHKVKVDPPKKAASLTANAEMEGSRSGDKVVFDVFDPLGKESGFQRKLLYRMESQPQ